jgi:hypothetical protein
MANYYAIRSTQSGAWFGSRAYYTSTATPARTEGLALSEVHRREGVGTLRIALCDKTASFFEFSLCLSRACLGKMFVFIYKWRKKTVLSPSAALSNHTKPSWLQRNAQCNANRGIITTRVPPRVGWRGKYYI